MLDPLCNEQGCVIIPVFQTVILKVSCIPIQAIPLSLIHLLFIIVILHKNPSYKVNEIGGKIIEILIENIAIRIIIHFKIWQHITIKN